MIKYTEFIDERTQSKSIQRENEDGSVSYIPIDPANSDYQAYLASLDEASTL